MVGWPFDIVLGALLGAIGLVFVRLVRGPTLADRVVALDMMAVVAISFLTVYAVASGQSAYVDVALTLALIAFLATVSFARFVERSGEAEERQ